MKYIIPFCLLVCFLSACAGNPPAWWNPNNRYGVAENQPAQKTKAATKKQVVVREETIDTFTDVSYEEEILAPLPEEEEPAVSAENSVPEKDSGSLPSPSVLE